jgi:PST family polysaccharide transporter
VEVPLVARQTDFHVCVKEMLKFGLHWIGFSGSDFAGKFADRIAIGRASGPTDLGYYQKACLVYDNCLDLVITPLQSVAMVGLSKLRNDREALWVSWSKALSTVAFFAMPAFGILAVTSRDIIVLALGEKWTSASILLSIFALRGIPHVVQRTCGWALVLTTYVLFLPAIAYSGWPLGIRVRKVVAVVGPQTVGALTAVAVGFVLRATVFAPTPMILRTILLVIFYSAAYAVIVLGLFGVRTPLQVGRSVLRACVA